MTGALATAIPDLKKLVAARNLGGRRGGTGVAVVGVVWPATPAPSLLHGTTPPTLRPGRVASHVAKSGSAYARGIEPEARCAKGPRHRERRRQAIASRLSERFAAHALPLQLWHLRAQRDALLRGVEILEALTSGSPHKPSVTSVCVVRLGDLRAERASGRWRCIFSHRRRSGLAAAWSRPLDWQFALALYFSRLNIRDCQS